MNKVRPETQQLRDKLLGVLAAAYPQRLDTNEVLAALRTSHGCNYKPYDGAPARLRIAGMCNSVPQEACRAWCWYHQAYPQLRLLAQGDRVEWLPAGRRGGTDDMRLARWRYIPDLGDADLLYRDVQDLD